MKIGETMETGIGETVMNHIFSKGDIPVKLSMIKQSH
jgi:hypothetical protein